MPRTLLSTILALSLVGARLTAAQTPVYKLLWSPPNLDSPGGQPTVIIEVAPGLFDVLGGLDQSTFGASVFSVTSSGTYNLLYSQPAYFSSSALAQATNGKLYNPGWNGNTKQWFYFSATAAGKDLVEYSLPPNLGSAWQTIAAPGGIYDILGGSGPQGSTTFAFAQISDIGQFTILHQFTGSDGTPTGIDLALGSDNNFYGVGNQQHGGISPGFIFRLTPKGEYSQLVSFPKFPTKGFLSIISASDGNLYGLFGAGGPKDSGELYRATLSGELQTLAYFPSSMALPQTLMQASDGNIYGSTNSNVIFRYDLTSHALTNAYQMDGAKGLCYCQLIQGMDGKLYGVTGNGGPWPGIGAVFSVDLGLPRPKPVVTGLYPAEGAAGQEVMLWGRYVLGATSVTFNGVAATNVHVTSGQSAWATVPAGASSGPVTITTPNGSFTTTQSFTVQ
jgi:IPT/TIG domain-containing protein